MWYAAWLLKGSYVLKVLVCWSELDFSWSLLISDLPSSPLFLRGKKHSLCNVPSVTGISNVLIFCGMRLSKKAEEEETAATSSLEFIKSCAKSARAYLIHCTHISYPKEFRWLQVAWSCSPYGCACSYKSNFNLETPVTAQSICTVSWGSNKSSAATDKA